MKQRTQATVCIALENLTLPRHYKFAVKILLWRILSRNVIYNEDFLGDYICVCVYVYIENFHVHESMLIHNINITSNNLNYVQAQDSNGKINNGVGGTIY